MLASPETASDADYAAILGVIGHEVCYLHLCEYLESCADDLNLDGISSNFWLSFCAVFPQLDWQ